MLVVSRKNQESVAIASTDGHSCLVKVTIVEIRGERVRLGFEAKLDVPVHRWEVWQRMAEERIRASDGAFSDNQMSDVTAAEETNQHGLRPGDPVRVKDGVFAGIEGTIARRQVGRVIVDLPLVQPGVSIEIDAHLLEPIEKENAVASPGELVG
jgi:carbon storage regulator